VKGPVKRILNSAISLGVVIIVLFLIIPLPEFLLDVLLVKKVTRLQVPLVIGKYKDGRYKELPELVRHLRTRELKIRCDKATPVNLDGEVRMAQVVDFCVADEKLRFFYPKGLVWQVKEQASVQ
jgi:diacylglycerol kinase family enzyme